MTTTLSIENLNYRRNLKKILTDVSLTLSGDKIVGLLGENGAGKTTLMRLIAGVAKNAKGLVAVNNETALATRKSMISYSDPLGGMATNLKITDVKSFYQRVYPDFDEQKYDQMSSFLKLDESQRLSALSKGTREKLVISLTLARQTNVYLLDEPFSGIDSMSRKKIINSIIQWKPADSLMIISDHYVSEIAPILDEIVVIKDNTVAVHKAADAIREENGQSIEDYYESLYGEADSND
ncbi:ATP-binding cassette domain-containing protein [Lactobacillus sp. LC28-10]|uniref:ATP-binding cassette domain-containing protein n=1 Tax=Secundilactobacillus angelensis TaxID=2722706 RepID=A0ABX1KXB0_9LACO|nr:ATP-binding cassette domain-containing protein [Secundilactobacillus angelensis]MCH5461577.1 ATP-binding cassette domain-containing protein [Secundilactobacillus angelensis]NLR17872.1 ATP-binding cassette domain-containing protein [Secundilactobacillus angelensis]